MEGHQQMNAALRGVGPKATIVTQDDVPHPHAAVAVDSSKEAVAAREAEYPQMVYKGRHSHLVHDAEAHEKAKAEGWEDTPPVSEE